MRATSSSSGDDNPANSGMRRSAAARSSAGFTPTILSEPPRRRPLTLDERVLNNGTASRSSLEGTMPGTNESATLSRKSFLTWLLGTSLGAALVAALYPVFRFVIPPEVAEAPVNRVLAG